MDDKFQELYDRVLSDSEFRNLLASNSKKALREIGIEPTEQILRALEAIKDDVEKLEDIFGGKRRFAI